MPEDIRALDTLQNPTRTYAWQVARPTADDRSAEQWARAVIEDAPRLLRWFIVAGWVVVLRLRLGPGGSSSYIQGYKILSNTQTLVIFGVESFALEAHLAVQVRDGDVVHATFVRYERPVARALWGLAAPIHRRVIPYLLRRAAVRR